MRANDGAWIGWPGGTDDDLEPFVDDGLSLVPVPLQRRGDRGLLRGLLQRHAVAALPRRGREAGVPPRVVGRLRRGQPAFAEQAAEVAAEDATVWVHDYQMQLVPAMLRELRPDLRIGFFLHIPFPPAELFQQLPWRRQLLEGLLGADVVGFQRPGGVAELRAAGPPAGRPQDAPRPDLPPRRPRRAGRLVPDLHRHPGPRRARPLASRSTSAAEEIREQLGNPRRCCSASTGSTTPRASSTGCAPSASSSRTARSSVDDTVFVQVATPSRERVEQYRRLRDEIDRLVGRLNGDLGDRQPGRSTTCTRPTPRRRWRRCSGPPTSWWSRRCATA